MRPCSGMSPRRFVPGRSYAKVCRRSPPLAARVLREPVNARAAMVVQVKVTAGAARRFLVARHFLAPARSLAGGPEAVLQVLRKFGSIQFDPIAVAGRNHDLVLHARVAGYEPAWCDVLYERREIFEATNKALSLVPTSEFPWFRHVMGRKGPRFHAAILAENAAVAERVLGRIRAEGALSTLDFEPEHGAPKDWFGMPENVVRAVLESYTVTGAIGLARRDGNLRYYDLLERLLPAELLAHEVPEREGTSSCPGTAPTACSAPAAPAARSTASPRRSRPRSGRGATNSARSWSSSARSCPSTSRACAASASSSPRNSRCCRRRRSRRPPSR